MSKKLLTFITFVVLSLVLIIGGSFIYFYTKSDSGNTGGVTEVLKKLNPFGSSDPLGIGGVIDKVLPGNSASSTASSDNSYSSQSVEQTLFKLSQERSSGIGFADVKVPKTIEVRKSILVDDPTVASTSKPRKISVLATTTEIIYSTTTRIRYVEQGSGHIYEYDFASSTDKKLTNTTIPRTQEAYFLSRGSKVLLRYLDDSGRAVENYLATIPVSSVADTLSGVFLPGNITSVSVSPNTSEILYVAKTSTGSVINIYNVDKNTERRVMSSPFSEWMPDWKGQNVFLTTKAHSSFLGSIYSQSLTKNSFTKVTGGIYGLTSLASPSGAKVLLGNGDNLSVLDVSSGVTTPIRGLFTLPEKCVWYDAQSMLCFGQEYLHDLRLPEDWYQGKSFLNDFVYMVDSTTGDYYFVGSPEALYKQEAYIDAVNLSISDDRNSLVFVNKIDMTPWYLNLGKALSYVQNTTENQ